MTNTYEQSREEQRLQFQQEVQNPANDNGQAQNAIDLHHYAPIQTALPMKPTATIGSARAETSRAISTTRAEDGYISTHNHSSMTDRPNRSRASKHWKTQTTPLLIQEAKMLSHSHRPKLAMVTNRASVFSHQLKGSIQPRGSLPSNRLTAWQGNLSIPS